VVDATELVLIVNGAEVAPSDTVIEAGTVASNGSEVARAITAPPAGAALSSVIAFDTVETPPTGALGLSLNVNTFATVTTNEADWPGAATLVAVIVTSVGAEIVAGAVYSPVEERVPTAGLSDHLTR